MREKEDCSKHSKTSGRGSETNDHSLSSLVGEGNRNGKRILVIDDEEVTRKVLGKCLSGLGYEIEEAADGEEGIENFQRKAFDLVICDIVMPKKSGWDVIREIRSNSERSDVPIIVLTSKGSDDDISQGYNLGATYYVPKPFTRAQLLYGIRLVTSPAE